MITVSKASSLVPRACVVLRIVVTIALSLPALTVRSQGYTYEQLYAFAADTNGYGPEGALVQGADGYLYGTCAKGGQPTTNFPAGGYGTVFRMTSTGVLTAIAWFHGTTGLTNGEGLTNYGGYPFGGMIQATNGSFYGDSEYGLFRITPDGALTARGGGGWVGDPIQGGDGCLYYANLDTIFRSPLNGGPGMQWTAPGSPSGGLIQASDGNFYGLTYNGGSYGTGTAYRLTTDGALKTLVSFGPRPNAPLHPYGKLLQASDGDLYGVADTGEGVVFRLTLAGALTNLAWFGVGDAIGGNPNGGLIEANDGNFYGTTFEGGPIAGAQGTVFKMTPQGHISTLVVFSYRGAHPGSGPLAGLVQGSDGNLYGTCAYGGTFGGGNIFRIIMPGPQLISFRSDQQLVLSWRTNYAGFTVQSSTSLAPANWIDCTSLPIALSGQYWVTNPISISPQFFRLRKGS